MTEQVGKEKLLSDFKALIADAEALLEATASQVGDGAATVRQRLQEKLEEGKKLLGEEERELLDKAKEAAAAAESYMRAHPWRAVAAAAGVGVVLGLLVRRG